MLRFATCHNLPLSVIIPEKRMCRYIQQRQIIMQDNSKTNNIHNEHFTVRTYETGINNRVTLPSYCNYLQEAASNHSRNISQKAFTPDHIGFVWILTRLHMIVDQYVRWRDEIQVTTWPSGVRDRITALRDFIIEDKWESPVLQGVSEWHYLDMMRMQISALPDYCTRISSGSVSRAEVPDTSGSVPHFGSPTWQTPISVRNSDHDFNNHVNNSHYIEWLFEALPPEWLNRKSVTELDINFKAAARHGDIVISEAVPAMENGLLHQIKRESDGSIIATARTHWEEL